MTNGAARRRGAVALTILLLPAAGCMGGEEEPLSHAREVGAGFSDTAVFPGTYNMVNENSRPLAPGPHRLLPPLLVTLVSLVDEVPIQIAVVRPDAPGPVPIIAVASPYLTEIRDDRAHPSLWPTAVQFVDVFVPHGYAVALVPVRGTSGSGGCIDWWGPNERSDLDQAITWLGEQEWSSGAVGMLGASYEGAAAWEVASHGNPRLRTIVVTSAPTGLESFLIHNGTVMGAGAPLLAGWHALWGLRNRTTDSPPPPACPETISLLTASAVSGATGETTAAFAARELRRDAEENYEGSLFYIQGLADGAVLPHNSIPWIERFAGTGRLKMLLGQWGHSNPDMADGSLPSFARPTADYGVHPNPTRRWDFAEMLLRWFDRELKGFNTNDIGPRVEVADSSYKWRIEHEWPPADARPTDFFLTPDGRLSSEPSATTAQHILAADPVRYGMDPHQLDQTGEETCAACVVFSTRPLEDELRFAGVAHLAIPVMATGNGGTIAARLEAVSPTARHTLTTGVLDLRFSDGTSTSKLVQPGDRLSLRVEFEAADAVIPKGAALVLTLSQAGHGNADFVYLTYYRPSSPPFPIQAAIGETQSLLQLPRIERDEGTFFNAP